MSALIYPKCFEKCFAREKEKNENDKKWTKSKAYLLNLASIKNKKEERKNQSQHAYFKL